MQNLWISNRFRGFHLRPSSINQTINNENIDLLLDSLAPTYGAWSVTRQLKSDYIGPLIRTIGV